MKKVLSLCLGIVLATAAIALAGISSDQAAKILKDALAKQGYQTDVEIGDVDKNGTDDIAIEYLSGNPKDTVLHLLAAVTGGSGALDENVDWPIDKVFVLIKDDLWYASMSGINKCYAVIMADDTDDTDVENCLDSIWNQKK